MLELLSKKENWEAFYRYKTSLACPKEFSRALRKLIDEEAYLPVCDAMKRGDRFPLPKKAVISKMSSQKKRTVYSYPEPENTVLKLLTWLLLRKYDGIFADNLYSFRPGRTAKDAVMRLTHIPGIRNMYAYKADISNYFNSIPVAPLLDMLETVLKDDPSLYSFLRSLLTEPQVLDRGHRIEEEKGIMAGTPLSAFYANLYLQALDRRFEEEKAPYARYSDDVILFAQTPDVLSMYVSFLQSFLKEKGLTLNPDKEKYFTPEEGWVFLGFQYAQGKTDVAPASLEKLKQKMRRKARALQRWRKRNDVEPEKAARAFIRVFNRKLFENPADNDLTWSLWYFPVLTSADGLREIDRYAQDCIRWLLSDTRTKARYNVRYEELKALGYRCLVHEYFQFRDALRQKINDE